MRKVLYLFTALSLFALLVTPAHAWRNGRGILGRFFNRNSNTVELNYRERNAAPQVEYRSRGVSPYPEDNGIARCGIDGECPLCDRQAAQVDYVPAGPSTYEYIPPVDPGYGLRYDRFRNLTPVDPAYGVENRIERDRLAIWYRNQGIDPRRAYWYRNRDEGNLDFREAYYLRNRDDRDLGRYYAISDRGRGDLCDSFGLPIGDYRGRLDVLEGRIRDLEARGFSRADIDARLALLEQDRALLENGMVAILKDRDGREIRRTRFGTRCPLCISLAPELAR
jgi:hypothetical protein